jgi:hypothetical protein
MAPQLQLLGRIARLQIQTAPLKLGEKPDQRYDPAALLVVETLTLTAAGAEARRPAGLGGERVLDVHHLQHPQSRQNQGENALSVGFTAHYAALRAHFGEHAALGCAGENIIVATDQRITLDTIRGGLFIQGAAQSALVALDQVQVAAPCLPFTRYMLREPAAGDKLKRSLQFLDGGLRGFYVALAGAGPVTVILGDPVFVAA